MRTRRNNKVIMFTMAPMLFDARIQREAKSLSIEGYDVKIIYLEDKLVLKGVPNLEDAQASYKKDMGDVISHPVFLITRNWRKLPKVLSHFLQSIELFFKFSFLALTQKADVYHIHDLKPGIFGLIALMRFKKAKLVYDAHELEITTGGKRLERFMFKYEKMVIGKSRLNITVNEEIKDIMEKAYHAPVIVVGNKPIHVNSTEIEDVDLKLLFNLPADAKIIMYIGYVSKIRGIEQTIQAMKFLPTNVYFLLMGVGRLNEFKEYLLTFCNENQLNDVYKRVLFIGPFPPDDIINYLHSADLSVMLYQKFDENSSINAPNKLYQSIMARTPVLASHNESFPKLVYENGIGSIGETVDQTNPAEIAEKIAAIFSPESQSLYRKNSELLTKSISWSAEELKLINGYNSI